jgi:hypothetical protein
MSRDLCIMACVFCKSTDFQAWLTELDQIIHPGDQAINEAGAKEFILAICQIDSRNELDTNAGAAERFHTLVRLPFLAWKETPFGAAP